MAKKTLKTSPVPADEPIAEVVPDPPLAAAADEALSNIELPTITPDTLLEVWERRFVNPGSQPSQPIMLKVEGMTTRWINTTIEGRYHRAVYDQGWQPVPVRLLADPKSIPDLYKHPDGIVARGERGKEVLMMMPKQVFQRIQRRKAEIEQGKLRNIRSEVAGAVARANPAAAEFAERGQTADGNIKMIGTIRFGTERVAPEE